MELSAFEVDVLDNKNYFLLAETQGEFSMDSLIDEVNVSKSNVDCENEVGHKNIVVDKYKYTTGDASVKGKLNNKNASASTANAGIIKEMVRVASMEQAWKPEEQLLVYNTDMESEAENVLLSEMSRSNPVDCSSFADFNEFNLCLNNMLSYDDDDIITESLSPRAIVQTNDIIHSSEISCSSSPKTVRDAQDTTNNWSQRLTPASEEQLQNIFDIDQLGEDMNLQHFRTDDQIQPQSFTIESALHILEKSEIGENKFGGTEEQKTT